MRRKAKYYVLVQETTGSGAWYVDVERDTRAEAAAAASAFTEKVRIVRGYDLEVDRQTTVVLR
jgi:hypothetical protein